MKEVIKYIYYGSEFGSIVKSWNNELWFNMDHYWIVLRLSSLGCLNINNDDIPKTIVEPTFESLLNIKRDDIESVTILSGEYIPDDEEDAADEADFGVGQHEFVSDDALHGT